MIKIATMAGAAGALTSLLTVVGGLYGQLPQGHSWGTLTQAVAVVLFFDIVIALVGPRRVFYSTALISVALIGAELAGSGSGPVGIVLAVISADAVTLVLSIVAARFETQVSEQSHPMNLPVFG